MKIKLCQIRQEKRLTTRQLEKLSGVSHSCITKIETGESMPTVIILCKLAKAMNVKIEDLVDCDD